MVCETILNIRLLVLVRPLSSAEIAIRYPVLSNGARIRPWEPTREFCADHARKRPTRRNFLNTHFSMPFCNDDNQSSCATVFGVPLASTYAAPSRAARQRVFASSERSACIALKTRSLEPSRNTNASTKDRLCISFARNNYMSCVILSIKFQENTVHQ